MAALKTVRLSSGYDLPTVGLGVYQAGRGKETYNAVLSALKLGYRHVDTAQVYGNEADVGKALKDSGVPRGDVFITTKLWRNNWGHAEATAAVAGSLEKLGTPYVDLFLLHCPGTPQTRVETWRALEDAHKQGKIRSLGVSNFGEAHLAKLATTATILPAVNQIELSPFLQRPELAQYCKAHNIVVEAYSPLCQAAKLDHPVVTQLAGQHKVTAAQVLIRWSLQKGFVPLPKSVDAGRQRSNLDVFGFDLTPQDMAQLDGLEENLMMGWDPITQDAV